MLAWIRTGIALMGFGFAIARFGVFLRQVASVGQLSIHVARGVSVHGWAINVATPAEAWARIKPCGLDVPQLSMASVVGAITVEQVAIELAPRLLAAVG